MRAVGTAKPPKRRVDRPHVGLVYAVFAAQNLAPPPGVAGAVDHGDDDGGDDDDDDGDGDDDDDAGDAGERTNAVAAVVVDATAPNKQIVKATATRRTRGTGRQSLCGCPLGDATPAVVDIVDRPAAPSHTRGDRGSLRIGYVFPTRYLSPP